MSNRERVTRFYRAFQQRDASGMMALYHPNVKFEDEVFELDGRDAVGAMWSMLCARGKDMTLEFEIEKDEGELTEVIWTARYSFSQTGRKVVNRIRAVMRWQDGLILSHRDHFDFWRWSRQALGLPGFLLGWSPFLRAKVKKSAAQSLAAWQAQKGR